MSDLCWLCVLSSIIVAFITPAHLFSCLFATWLNLHDILDSNIDIYIFKLKNSAEIILLSHDF